MDPKRLTSAATTHLGKLLNDPGAPFLPRLVLAGAVSLASVFVVILFASLFADRSPRAVELSIEQIIVPEADPLPDFDAIQDIDEKKRQFFSFLLPYVQAENNRINDLRDQVATLWEIVNGGAGLSPSENTELAGIAQRFRLDTDTMTARELLQELMLRVDNIPASLVLAQAASESAWGTSRFAKEGNNIFGQWCFDEGCGLVPERRAADAEHEVRAFASIEASVRAYFRNINTNAAYSYFRQMRHEMRERGTDLDATVLAYGLMSYSSRGHVYINELQEIIRINQLQVYDRS